MKKISIIFFSIILFFSILFWYADATNPYGKFRIVKPFFVTTVEKNGEISLHQTYQVYFVKNPFVNCVTFLQRGFRILANVYVSEKLFQGSEQQIIQQIHTERFTLDKPYVVTGPNFSEFYVRNFGIFYAAMLDPRFALSQKDWEIRQRVTLQTIATHLALLKASGKEYTTFVPLWSNTFTGTNWIDNPSDSLFAAYYTLSALTNDQFIATNFPASTSAIYTLQTKEAGKRLLSTYTPVLSIVTNTYISDTIDPATGFIKSNIILSGARDGIKLQSSFYNNVITWATAKLAMELGVTIKCPATLQKNNRCDINKWKQNIMSTFWDDKTGIFLEDLSAHSKKNHTYTGEAFTIIHTGFFDFHNQDDRKKLEREIAYVQNNRLDTPFPLFFAAYDEPEKLPFFVRYFATSYMGHAIWSHAGMGYIKSLLLLAKDNPHYVTDAARSIQAYRLNIERNGGYPELYDKNGTIFQTAFYKSVLHTGWVIDYEQTNMMYTAINKSI